MYFTSLFHVPHSAFLTYTFSSCRYHQRVVWHVSPVASTQEILLPLSLQHGLRNGHAFDVFAQHGVVPRFAFRLHPIFSEECRYNDFQVFRRSSCSSLSIAVSGARSPQRKPPRMGSLLVTGSLLPSTFVDRLEAVPKLPPLFGGVRGCPPSLPATMFFF